MKPKHKLMKAPVVPRATEETGGDEMEEQVARKCRLRHGIILQDGVLHKRGEVLLDSQIPDHLRDERYISYEDHREGRVMLLHGLIYTADPIMDGCASYPVTLGAGELIVLEDIPERQRQGLQEGVDYEVDWTDADQARLRHEQTQRELDYFQPEQQKPLFYRA